MNSTENNNSKQIIEFFNQDLLEQKEVLLQGVRNKIFSQQYCDNTSYYTTPVVDYEKPSDFELPEINTIDQLANAMLDFWRHRGVSIDPVFVKRLSELAIQLKSDVVFQDQPSAFIYTL